jgi:hypothetical protein
LHLARIGLNRSLWARQHVLEAQRILSELFTRAARPPGLLKAAADANRTFSWHNIDRSREYYRRTRSFIEERWKRADTDAAEAGYRLSQLFATSHEADYRQRQRLLEDVIDRFPDSDWAIQAEFDLIEVSESLDQWTSNEPGDDTHLQQYVAFADRYPEHPLAAGALLRAAQSYGFGDYGQAQHGGVSNVQRLERAMELHVRYQREYPKGALRDPDSRPSQFS